MTENNNSKKKYIWPDTEKPCIWMEAGIVSYKLCDRNYDCENCYFDAIMHSRSQITKSSADLKSRENKQFKTDKYQGILLKKFRQISYDPKAYYGIKYWVFKPEANNRIVISLNDIAMKLLPQIDEIIFPQDETCLKANESFCCLKTNHGYISLTSPFAAQIERVNPNLLSDLNEQKISNTRKVWFLKLKVDHLDKKLINLPSGEKALHFLQNQQSNLLSHIMNVLQKEKYIQNHTLQDGGEYIQDLEKVLGPNRYFQLVSSILS